MQSHAPGISLLSTTCSIVPTTLWLMLVLSCSQLSWALAPDTQGPLAAGQMASQNGSSTGLQVRQAQDMKLPLYLRVLATLVSVIIFTVGVCGNLLVPLVVIKTKYLRNSTNLFLINLSVADLLVLIVCMPTVLVELHSRPETWSLGEPMCKLSNYVEMLAANGSIFTILAISFERYYAICEPLKAGYKCTRLRATIIICLIWLLSSLLTSPILLMAKSLETIYIDGSLVNNCILETDTYWNKMYVFSSMIGFFCLPLLVLVLVYWLIGRRLTRENLAMSTNTSLATSSSDSSHSPSNPRASSGRHLFSSFQCRRGISSEARLDQRSLAKSFTCATAAPLTGSWAQTRARPRQGPARSPANKALSLDNHLMEINKFALYSGDSFEGLNGGGVDSGLSVEAAQDGLYQKEPTIREEEEEDESDNEQADDEQEAGGSVIARLVNCLSKKRLNAEHKSIKREKRPGSSQDQQPNSNDSSLKRYQNATCTPSSDTCCRLLESSAHEEPLLSKAAQEGGVTEVGIFGSVIRRPVVTKKHSRFNWVRGFSVSSSSGSMQTNCTSLLLSEGGSALAWKTGGPQHSTGIPEQTQANAYFEPDIGAPDSCLDSLPGSSCSSDSCSPDPMEPHEMCHQQPPLSAQSGTPKVEHKHLQPSNTSTPATPTRADSSGILSVKNCSESKRVRKYEHKLSLISDYCDSASDVLQLASGVHTESMLSKPEASLQRPTATRPQAALINFSSSKSVDVPATHVNNHNLYPNLKHPKRAPIKRRSQASVQFYGSPPHLSEFLVMQTLSKKQQMDSRRQVVMMLAFVVTCFFLLFLPYRVFTIWLILSSEEQVQSLGMETYYNLTYFSRILIYLHSAINPIVYNLISTKFRRAFTSLLFCQGSGSRRKFTNANYATNHKNHPINDPKPIATTSVRH